MTRLMLAGYSLTAALSMLGYTATGCCGASWAVGGWLAAAPITLALGLGAMSLAPADRFFASVVDTVRQSFARAEQKPLRAVAGGNRRRAR